MILLIAGATLLLAGCGPKRVRADFTHYENSYAVTSNQELLLNLARLEQHDPTYFFKLGQINSSYRMEAALTGAGNVQTVTNPPATTIPTGTAAPTLLYENDPSFSFIPVNDQTNAQLLLQPVPENVFYSLFQQGWRVDQLFRLMVDRIEVTLPPDPDSPTDKGCRVEVIRNVPPPSIYGTDFSQSASDIDRYITFLRVSAVVYALQKHGLLLLRGTNTFQAVDKQSFIPNDKRMTRKRPPARNLEPAARIPAARHRWTLTSPSRARAVAAPAAQPERTRNSRPPRTSTMPRPKARNGSCREQTPITRAAYGFSARKLSNPSFN